MVFTMNLYPKILNIKKSYFVIKLLILISFILSASGIIVNLLTTPNIKWSYIGIVGIIYSWITTMYAIKKNTNISAYVMIQMILISILVVILDFLLGYNGWAVNYALPIIIWTANLTMFVLTIVAHRRYYSYAIYQFIIFLLSISLFALFLIGVLHNLLFVLITIAAILINLIGTLILVRKDLKEELIKRFHI